MFGYRQLPNIHYRVPGGIFLCARVSKLHHWLCMDAVLLTAKTVIGSFALREPPSTFSCPATFVLAPLP